MVASGAFFMPSLAYFLIATHRPEQFEIYINHKEDLLYRVMDMEDGYEFHL